MSRTQFHESVTFSFLQFVCPCSHPLLSLFQSFSPLVGCISHYFTKRMSSFFITQSLSSKGSVSVSLILILWIISCLDASPFILEKKGFPFDLCNRRLILSKAELTVGFMNRMVKSAPVRRPFEDHPIGRGSGFCVLMSIPLLWAPLLFHIPKHASHI